MLKRSLHVLPCVHS